ncbi:lasso peptide biosynthesis B2 protein [Streptomyces sp. NRRL B-1347]|uniref:lasso peptide biosynthesis B2 protein n=1 Tax=Streptomyces sp. NRRL B-1347 TaxID=1476877 RepID=UPI00099C37F5|nr:lasso peptide biosynthesis B2 protein [Streptomyces sp. NRRL B-1347]
MDADHTNPGGCTVSRTNTVVARSSHVSVVIDYDTGTTELRPTSDAVTAMGATVVSLPDTVPTWGTVEQSTVPPEPGPIPMGWRIAAVPVVLATAVTWAAGKHHERFSRLIRLACLGRDLPPATLSQARYAVRAVRWAAQLLPMRWACLEDSTAAALLLTVTRRRAEWRHGVALDPVRLHAWIAGPDGAPVEEPADTALYTPTYTPDGPGSARATRGVRP